ncbi:hypothetical protein EIP91_008265 [Steccherinum ochraceum]|uniref:Uncharacterized protein n=1 Tax=Steccherinum ochraceum TaxID=92696 RepID=A0A4R0R5U0_9APHY|nr:hypothetical protein EIP91_008265 [Steccherinum ochraceum]
MDDLACPQCSPAVGATINRLLSTAPHSLPLSSQNILVLDAEAAIESCHQAVTEYQRVISLLSAKRNACTVSYRIPHELLGHIMWFSVDTSIGSASLSALDRVSRHWRAVALGTPKLWSFIIANSKTEVRVVETMLSRAQGIPLNVSIWSDPPKSRPLMNDHDLIERRRKEPNPVVLANLLGNLPRIRVLSLRISAASIRSLNEKISRGIPAPQLRSLNLVLDYKRDAIDERDPGDEGDVDVEENIHDEGDINDFELEPPILHVFSGVELPKLRKLRLVTFGHRLQNQLAPLAAPSITDFTMEAFLLSRTDALAPDEFKAALCDMPRLRRLVLAGNVLLPGPPLKSEERPIFLARLKDLKVSGSLTLMLWIVDHIRIPTFADVKLFTQTFPGFRIGASPSSPSRLFGQRIMSLLLERMSRKQQTLKVVVSPVEESHSDEYRMCFSPDTDPDQPQAAAGSITIVISRLSYMQEDFTSLVSALPLDYVRELSICGHEDSSKYTNLASWSVYRQLIGRMKSLRVLRFVSIAPEHLAHANMLLWPGEAEGEHVLPNLTTLKLRDMPLGDVDASWSWSRIGNTEWNGRASDDDPWPSGRIGVLKRTLALWQDRRGPLDLIGFENCNISDAQLDDLGFPNISVE